MCYKIEVIPKTLVFKVPAKTSRETYKNRNVWYVRITDEDERVGIGECAPLIHLSCDHTTDEAYYELLSQICQIEEQKGENAGKLRYDAYPSIDFGLQTAFKHLHAGGWAFNDTDFTKGWLPIQINGLVWMGNYDYMFQQIKKHIDEGFQCIKLKIGAIRFEEELDLLRYIRRDFSSDAIEIRVDANGAFSPHDALDKIEQLSKLDIHSIEQPIAAGQWEEMQRLTKSTPLPIVLDEELIGCNTDKDKAELLSFIRPQYIIIKPSLHSRPEKWVELCEGHHIGWWATSALESNIGLNAIAQWVSTYHLTMPQGLGTGKLFVENINVPLSLRGDKMYFIRHKN